MFVTTGSWDEPQISIHTGTVPLSLRLHLADCSGHWCLSTKSVCSSHAFLLQMFLSELRVVAIHLCYPISGPILLDLSNFSVVLSPWSFSILTPEVKVLKTSPKHTFLHRTRKLMNLLLNYLRTWALCLVCWSTNWFGRLHCTWWHCFVIPTFEELTKMSKLVLYKVWPPCLTKLWDTHLWAYLNLPSPVMVSGTYDNNTQLQTIQLRCVQFGEKPRLHHSENKPSWTQ